MHGADRHPLARHLRADRQRDALVRLDMDQQHVRPQPVAGDLGEWRMWSALELNRDRRLAPREPLAHPHVERRVGPAPVVDEELRRDVGLGHRVVRDAGLLAIRHDLLALDEPGTVLAADHRLRAWGVQRAQHLHLLVPHRIGGEIDRRLHRRQRKELQQVVLEDVADRAGALVESRASFDAHRLGDRDLDMVDELSVPDRLENAVREPQREHVLDRFLAEVVVDPKDLVFGVPLLQDRSQLASGGSVVAKRLLDDHARPALALTTGADLVDDRLECLRRHSKVEDPVAERAVFLVALVEQLRDAVLAGRAVELGSDVAQTLGERVPHILAERVAGVLLHRLLHRCGELGRRLLRARDADNRELLGQQVPVGHRVERGKELPHRQVA